LEFWRRHIVFQKAMFWGKELFDRVKISDNSDYDGRILTAQDEEIVRKQIEEIESA